MISVSSLRIEPCDLDEIRGFVEKHHYSHNVNGVKISKCFAVRSSTQLCGGVIFGALSTTAWKKYGESEEEVLELRRLVLLDEVGKNAESHVVGRTIRWIRQHRPEVKVIVCYADPLYGHNGLIYRACNFKYMGISGEDKGYRDPDTGKVYHSRALRTCGDNGDYKPFVKELRRKLEANKLEIIDLPGKHCYIYEIPARRFKRPHDNTKDPECIEAWL